MNMVITVIAMLIHNWKRHIHK